jgi:hypothetical protein
MKNGKRMLWGLALAGLTACVDLGEDLVGVVTTEYFSTPAGLEAAVNGAYAQLQGFFGREEAMALTEMGTDMWSTGDQGGYKYMNTHDAGLSPTIGQVQFPWNSFYRGINTSNTIVERAPAVTGMDPTVKAIRIAEARFLRALSYFYLVQMFGPVHLTLTESRGIVTAAHRTPADSIYAQIVADLDSAVRVLPAAQSQPGRATRWAAMHLLAKVYLTRAYKPYTVTGDFQRARIYADSVITNSGRALLPNYGDLFCTNRATNPGAHCDVTGLDENNSEVIFAVQFTTTSGQFSPGSGNVLHVVYLSFYDDRQGMARDCNNGRGFRRIRPTLHTRNLWQRWTDSTYTTVLDTRYDGSFQSVWLANWSNPGACTQTQGAARGAGYTAGTCNTAGLPTFGTNCTNGEALVIGDTAIWQPGRMVGQAFRQSVKYAIFEPCTVEPCPPQTTVGQYDEFRYPTLKKFQDNQRPDFNNLDGGKDLYLMRLGETYLLAAEAALGLGDEPGARGYLVTLRQRAAVGAAEKAMIVDAAHMPAKIDLDYILDERGRELAGELHRWFDLARTERWQRITQYNLQATGFTLPKHALRPIPQSQVDLVDGGPQAFPQNPGY